MKTTRNDIITLPNANLRTTSKKIKSIDSAVRSLIKSMEEATLDWEDHRKHEVGVALAAIQIDEPVRIVVIRNDFDHKEDRAFKVFVNPEITKSEGSVREDYEGCLSIPEIYGKVPRYTKVRVKALDENGKQIRVTAEGFLARVFQHEIDHTNGTLFIDHIKNKDEAFYRLDEGGKLTPLDYSKDIKNNKDLWS